MKYLTFLSIAISLTMLVLLVIIGIRLDVLIAEIMQIYMTSLITAFASFVLSVIMLMKQLQLNAKANAKGGKDNDYSAS